MFFIQDTKKLIKQTMKIIMMLSFMNFVSFVAGDSLGWVSKQMDWVFLRIEPIFGKNWSTIMLLLKFSNQNWKFCHPYGPYNMINMVFVILKSENAGYFFKYQTRSSDGLWIAVFQQTEFQPCFTKIGFQIWFENAVLFGHLNFYQIWNPWIVYRQRVFQNISFVSIISNDSFGFDFKKLYIAPLRWQS